MIKLGDRAIQRIMFIAKDGERDKVMKWCERTGYVLTNSEPVHNVLLVHADRIRARRLPKHLKPVPNPLGIVKGMALYTAERAMVRRRMLRTVVYVPPGVLARRGIPEGGKHPSTILEHKLPE